MWHGLRWLEFVALWNTPSPCKAMLRNAFLAYFALVVWMPYTYGMSCMWRSGALRWARSNIPKQQDWTSWQRSCVNTLSISDSKLQRKSNDGQHNKFSAAQTRSYVVAYTQAHEVEQHAHAAWADTVMGKLVCIWINGYVFLNGCLIKNTRVVQFGGLRLKDSCKIV